MVSTTPADEGSATYSYTYNGVNLYFLNSRQFHIGDADGRHPRTLANTVITRSHRPLLRSRVVP